MVKDTIVEISVKAKIGNFKEVLSRVLSNKIGNIDNAANYSVTNKMIVAGGFKGEVNI